MKLDKIESFDLGDLKIQEPIGRGSSSQVYRATRFGQSVAVKVMKAGQIGVKKEAAYLAMLKHPGIVEIFHVGEHDGRFYLVTEYVDGPDFGQILAKEGKLSESDTIAYGKAIASALAKVHENFVIHRDIKPQNILRNSRGEVKLIDFGFVLRQEEVPEDAALATNIAGTFLYSAPEQTGMLKRPIDGRTDLYALGVVLFEFATGRTPFQSTDPGELLRMHMAEPPPAMREFEPSISPTFDAIVAKLLAKDPDDRYQTATGLLNDLERISDWSPQTILGADDRLTFATHRVPLIGRDVEFAELSAVLDRAFKDQGAVLLLEGASGSGKTRLIQELRDEAQKHSALVLSAKATLSKQSPLSVIRSLLDGLLEGDQDKVKAAATEYAPVLRGFSKKFEDLFPDVKDIHSDNVTQELYYASIADFVQKLSRLYSGLVLVIDDVQWLDASSLACLKLIAKNIAKFPLLMACTARNDESSVASVSQFVSAVSTSLAARMTLAPISERFFPELIQAHLGEKKVSLETVQSITKLTGGNPFAVGEYVRTLLENGFLYPVWDDWHLDSKGLESLHLSNDVIDVVIRRIANLDEQTKQILQTASLIGSRFSSELLRRLRDKSEAYLVDQALMNALQSHLIEPTETDGEYQFVHDQIQESFLKSLLPEAQQGIHQALTLALVAKKNENGGHFSSSDVFALARHSSRGVVKNNLGIVYRANVDAGIQALEEYSNDEAYQYFKDAEPFGGETLDPVYQEMYGNACFRVGLFDQALIRYERALGGISDGTSRAEIHLKRARVYMAVSEYPGVQNEVISGYRELGQPIPKLSVGFAFSSLFLWVASFFIPKNLRKYRKLESNKRTWLRVYLGFNGPFGEVMYNTLQTPEFVFSMLRWLFYSRLMGPSLELAVCYAGYAILLSGLGLKKAASRYSNLSIVMAEQEGDPTIRASVWHYSAAGLQSGGDSRGCIARHHEFFEKHSKWTSLETYLGVVLSVNYEACLIGDMVSIKRQSEIAKQQIAVRQTRQDPSFWHFYLTLNPLYLSWSGQFTQAQSEIEHARLIFRGKPEKTTAYLYHFPGAVSFFVEQEEFGAPLDELLDGWAHFRFKDTFIATYRKLPELTPYGFKAQYVAAAYARLAQYEHFVADNEKRALRLTQFETAVRDLKRAANTPTILAHSRVVEGALARIHGHAKRARKLLLEAEAFAYRCDSAWGLYEIAVERARLFVAEKNPFGAMHQATIAHQIAVRGGWVPRAKRVAREFGLSEAALGSSKSVNTSMSGSSSVKSLSQERSLDALLRIGVASAHVLDPNLHIRLVLDELIKIMGAERGFVLLVNPKTDELELMSGRDRDGNDLSGVSKYSTTVVANVKDTRTAQIVCGSDEGEALGSESIVAQDLRSIMAVPLEIGERLIGVIYADSRIVKGLFTPDDLNLFKAIANHIASTLEMARAATVELEKQALEKDMALVAEKLNVAHAAGMAEVAIETIHNIGNILNTVGLRMARMADTLNDSELPAPVREKILKDVTPLERGLENIRTVVAAQQKYATVGLHKEATQIAPFLDEVLEMHMLRIHQQEIRVHKKYEEVPAVLLQKHKLLNVVSNLVENAIEAMSETQVGQKDLTIEIRPVDKFIEIRISDSGMGISPQELGSIFRQGYTTKKDGHGFGLHSCANAMSELGGSLEAESAGRAQGATFVLKIPTFT